ncbi:MAG: tyrosine-protein phosphatase [Burkholderiales bacterium]|nr:MAG: tyrosine-protein phosphatase [Burkholderiales bacterium]
MPETASASDSIPRLEGAPNFRAVDPLPAADGRLRAGRIFRSDALHRLTDVDVGALAAVDIGAVLDLRRDDERSQMPSRWPQRKPREMLTFDVLPDLQAVRAGGWRVQLAQPDFDATGAHRWMDETYARMPAALAPAVHEAARRLARRGEASTRVLVHCTAGKDRTGFVVAMLLAALGVSREAIVDDYLESSRRRPPAALADMLIALSDLQASPRMRAAIETIADVRADWLETALQTAERQHGSIDGYLSAAGVDAPLRAALRMTLLT